MARSAGRGHWRHRCRRYHATRGRSTSRPASGLLGAGERGFQGERLLFAEFDAPLVEAVYAPDGALDEYLMLIEGDELADDCGRELRGENGRARPVARHHLVRHHLRGSARERPKRAPRR